MSEPQKLYSIPSADPDAPKELPFSVPSIYRDPAEKPLADLPELEIQPARGYVLVKARPKGATAAGIIIPKTSRRTPRLAGYEIIAVGPPRMTSQGHPVPSIWSKGQFVAIFPGQAVQWDSQRDIIVNGVHVAKGTTLALVEDTGIFAAVSGDEDSLVSDIVGPDQCVE